MAKKVFIKDRITKEIEYPVTHIDCIVVNDENTSLVEMVKEVDEKIEELDWEEFD